MKGLVTTVDEMNAEEALFGEAGDDTIWGGAQVAGNLKVYGGSGDDTIYGGFKTAGEQFLYGGSGKDVISTAWYYDRDGTTESSVNEKIYGDYKYGEDALDKDLWGDADRIYGGRGDGAAEQRISAGDGDDYVKGGFNWMSSDLYLQNGDDTVFVP